MTPPSSSNDRPDVADALATDGLMVAARLIALNGLMAESAASRGDLAEAFARFRLVDAALQEAREIAIAAGRIVK